MREDLNKVPKGKANRVAKRNIDRKENPLSQPCWISAPLHSGAQHSLIDDSSVDSNTRIICDSIAEHVTSWLAINTQPQGSSFSWNYGEGKRIDFC